MSNTNKDKHPLKRDGLSQKSRFIQALDPAYPKIDDLSIEDWLNFAYSYASEINYFSATSPFTIDGDWSTFFNADNHDELLEKINAKEGNIDPHLALFIAFLFMIKHVKNALNELPKRHLDFYFKEVLQLKNKPFDPDHVHVIFKLAKKANKQLFVPKGTLLEAGKDGEGNPILFKTTNDNFVSQAKISDFRSIFLDYSNQKFSYPKIATVANSLDGLGEKAVEQGQSWKGMGHHDLPNSDIGFAIASENLLLQEGERIIDLSLELDFNNILSTSDKNSINNFLSNSNTSGSPFEIYFSGDSGWFGSYGITPSLVTNNGTLVSEIKEEYGKSYLNLVIRVKDGDPAILPYNNKKIQDSSELDTPFPVMQIRINKDDDYSGDFKNIIYNIFKRTHLKKVRLKTIVNGMKNISIENDNGRLDSSKPFMPFGSTPRKGSNFYVGSEEVFSKKLSDVNIDVIWHGLQDSQLDTYYDAYYNQHINNPAGYDVQANSFNNTGTKRVNNNSYFRATSFVEGFNDHKNQTLFNVSDANLEHNIKLIPEDSVQDAKVPENSNSTSTNYDYYHKFRKVPYDPNFGNSLNLNNTTRKGFSKITLQQSFLHESYPSLFAMAMMKNAKETEGIAYVIPKAPYTPMIESIKVNYVTKTYITDFTSKNETNFNKSEIHFFHLDAFGVRKEHTYLREKNAAVNAGKKVSLITSYNERGNLFLGIENATIGESINIFFQIAEETVSPIINRDNITIQWSVLGENYWHPIDKNNILGDTTEGLIKPGIVSIIIPKNATSQNTLLDKGKIWIKCSIKVADKYLNSASYNSILENEANTNAVGEMYLISAHGMEAEFAGTNYSNKIPANTINKMVNKFAAVKEVIQPYESFGGKADENDIDFYTRISERLKHKNRAVQISDYEQLILEEFKDVFQVKCFSHTSTAIHNIPYEIDDCWGHDNTNTFFAPGYVSVVVIPNLSLNDSSRQFYPLAPLSLLEKIDAFINQHNSMFVKFKAFNPVFEEIQLDFSVNFHAKGNFDYHRNNLENDILQFLTPWAFESNDVIQFGNSIHKSVIIKFIENLDYVNFVDDVKMYHFDSNGQRSNDLNLISTKDDRAILVPVNPNSTNVINHIIKEANSCYT